MKIVRINEDRGVDINAERIVIELNGNRYTLTELMDSIKDSRAATERQRQYAYPRSLFKVRMNMNKRTILESIIGKPIELCSSGFGYSLNVNSVNACFEVTRVFEDLVELKNESNKVRYLSIEYITEISGFNEPVKL